MKITTMIAALGLTLTATMSDAKTIRAADLAMSDWSQLMKTGEEVTIEFRKGDELPVSLAAEGDFLETTRPAVSYVGVKRDFWLRFNGSDIRVSLDGATYKPMKDVVSGTFMAGAGAGQTGGPANSINLAFKALLK